MNFIFASRLVSTIADQVLFFIIPLFVYKTTGSASLSGLSFALEWLPRAIAFLLSGVLGDRIGGAKLYIQTDFYRSAFVVAGIALLTLDLGGTFWILTIMGGGIGFFSSQAQLSMEMTIKGAFKEDEIPRAQAHLQMCEQLSLIFGPLLAGILLGFFDFRLIALIAGVLFFCSGLMSKVILGSAEPAKPLDSKKSAVASFSKGLSHILGSCQLRLLIVFSILANFFFGVILSLNPAIVEGVFEGTDQDLSALYTVAGLTTIASLLAASFLAKRFSFRTIGFTGIAVFVASAVGLALAPDFGSYCLFYSLLIAGVMLTNIMTRTYRVKLIPKEDFGITVGVILFLVKLTMPLSGFFVSILAQTMQLQNLILLSVSGSSLLFVLLWPLMRPQPKLA